MTLACETGLRPGDLVRLTRGNLDGMKRFRVRTQKCGRVVHKLGEMVRLNTIATELAKLDSAAASVGESLSRAKANRFIEIPLRIMAANIGAQQGTGGASLQTAQMPSGRVKEAMNHFRR